MCEFKCCSAYDVIVQRLTESLFVFSHVALPSLDRFSRLQNRLSSFRLQQVLHPYSLATFAVAVIRGIQSSPRFKSIVDFGVLHCYQCISLHNSAKAKKN